MDTPEMTGKSLKAAQHASLWCVLPSFIAAGYYTLSLSKLHVQTQHACVSGTVRYLLTMYVLNWLHLQVHALVFTCHLPAM